VALVAIHRRAIEVYVRQRCLIFVTSRAHARIDIAEIDLSRVVAFVAIEALVDDVLRVTWGKADFVPAFRHHAGGSRGSLLLDGWNHVGRETPVEEPTEKTEPCDDDYCYCGTLHRPPT
jgi:hypothetical protein